MNQIEEAPSGVQWYCDSARACQGYEEFRINKPALLFHIVELPVTFVTSHNV